MLRASVLLLHCRLDINNNTPSEGVHVLTTANLGVFSLGYFYVMAMIKMLQMFYNAFTTLCKNNFPRKKQQQF